MRGNKTIELSKVKSKAEYLKLLGDVSGFQVLNDLVLMAIFIEPEKTAGGVYLAQRSIEESRWQGKLGLMLKAGPTAFKYVRETFPYEGPAPKDGDWLVHRASDGWDMLVNGVQCRMIAAELVRGIVPTPDYVY